MNNLSTFLFLLFSLCFAQQSISQNRILSGTLTDSEGLPLIAANVMVKGTSNGTITDIDGSYQIECAVGDILVINYIGFSTQEIRVTASSFINADNQPQIEEAVHVQKKKAYQSSLKIPKNIKDSIPSFFDKTPLTFKGYHRPYNGLKDLTIDNNVIKLDYTTSELEYELNYNQDISLQFIPKNRFPAIQNSFSQGRTVMGKLEYRTADDQELFSFGPLLDTYNLGRVENNLYKSRLEISTGLQVKTNLLEHTLNVNLNHRSQDDLFRIKKSSSKQASIFHSYKNIKSNLSYYSLTDNQADINGNHQKILMHHLLTPAHFDNQEAFENGLKDYNGAQISNPFAIATNDEAIRKVDGITGDIGWSNYYHRIRLKSTLSFSKNNQEILFQKNHANEIASAMQYQKRMSRNQLGSISELDWDLNNGLYLKQNLHINYHQLDYTLDQAKSLLNTRNNSINLTRNKTALNWNKTLSWSNNDFQARVSNGIHQSTLHGFEFWQPKISGSANLLSFFKEGNGSNAIQLKGSYSSFIKELDLYYNNNSHNSLIINQLSYQALLETNDLFPSKELENERIEKLNLGIGSSFDHRFFFDLNYFKKDNRQIIFPVLLDGKFTLDNVADVRTNGFESNISYKSSYHSEREFKFSLNLKKESPKVSNTHIDKEVIAIAGFSDIGNVIQIGEVPGAIYGSTWARNRNGSIQIDAQGYPIKADGLKIIGNPNPDLFFDFSHYLRLNKFSVDLSIDGQLGGEFWNGTQAILDYYGRSLGSETLRTQQIIYHGELEDGQINATPVPAYDVNNNVEESIFQRYGYGGVAEDYIEDASYMNLKHISVNYKIERHTYDWPKNIEISFYAKNLFQLNNTKSRNPYSTFNSNPSAYGLQHFNRPLQSEIGLKFNVKL